MIVRLQEGEKLPELRRRGLGRQDTSFPFTQGAGVQAALGKPTLDIGQGNAQHPGILPDARRDFMPMRHRSLRKIWKSSDMVEASKLFSERVNARAGAAGRCLEFLFFHKQKGTQAVQGFGDGFLVVRSGFSRWLDDRQGPAAQGHRKRFAGVADGAKQPMATSLELGNEDRFHQRMIIWSNKVVKSDFLSKWKTAGLEIRHVGVSGSSVVIGG